MRLAGLEERIERDCLNWERGRDRHRRVGLKKGRLRSLTQMRKESLEG